MNQFRPVISPLGATYLGPFGQMIHALVGGAQKG